MNKELSKMITRLQKTMPTLIQDVNKSGIIKRIPLDSPQMLYLFSGGLPIGRIHRFRGPESAGKSTICNYLCGQIQKNSDGILNPEQKVVVYLDFERTFDKVHAEENGLICDEDHFIYMRPDNIEDVIDSLSNLIPTGALAAIVLDSDAAAPSKAQMINEGGKASFGGSARALGEMIRKFNILCSNYNTTMFWISQERANMTFGAHLPSITGGYAPNFYATTINRVTKKDTITQNNETVGISIRVRNYKNKSGICFRDANMNLYYKGGFDTNSEYLDFMINLGVINQAGAWFTNDKYGIKLNGRIKVAEWLKSHPEEYEQLRNETNEMIQKANELDVTSIDPENEAQSNEQSIEEIPDNILE